MWNTFVDYFRLMALLTHYHSQQAILSESLKNLQRAFIPTCLTRKHCSRWQNIYTLLLHTNMRYTLQILSRCFFLQCFFFLPCENNKALSDEKGFYLDPSRQKKKKERN